MPTRPDSPDPAGTAGAANPFATLGEGMGKGLEFFQDWMKAAGSALPHVPGAVSGATGIPGWATPTLDPAELDKRIQELRTVQFWLEQNARMIGMTIQGLEVQRMTLNTLQGMNVSMDQLKDALKVRPDAVQEMFKAAQPSPRAATAPPAPAAEPPSAEPPPQPKPASSWFQGVPDEPEPAPDEATDDATASTSKAAELINPMRWWDTLTQQFSHLASQAVPPGLRPASAEATVSTGATAPSAPNPFASTPGAPPGKAPGARRRSAATPRAARPTPTQADDAPPPARSTSAHGSKASPKRTAGKASS